jgi:hypothetical protein
VALLAAPVLFAQDAPPEMEKPGEHHTHLKMLAGTWDVKSKMFLITGEVLEGRYVETATLLDGGFWLVSNLTGKFMGTPFHGHSVLGYEAHKKQYTGMWVDSFASVMLLSKGYCEKNGKVNIMIGTSYDPMQKRNVTIKMVTEIKDANTKILRMFDVQGKKKTLVMEAVYKRRIGPLNKGAKFNGPFTHTIAGLGGVHYYLGGPQQARPPEGKFKPGTRVKLIRKNGSYCVVKSETGITAHVATAALKPIAE